MKKKYLCIYDHDHYTQGDSVEDAFDEMQGQYSQVEIDDCEFFELFPLHVEREVVWSIQGVQQ